MPKKHLIVDAATTQYCTTLETVSTISINTAITSGCYVPIVPCIVKKVEKPTAGEDQIGNHVRDVCWIMEQQKA